MMVVMMITMVTVIVNGDWWSEANEVELTEREKLKNLDNYASVVDDDGSDDDADYDNDDGDLIW